MNPGVRILTAFAFSLAVSVSDRFFPVLFGLIISLIIATLARIQVKKFLKRILYANLFILFLWLFLPFAIKGENILQTGPFNI